MNNFLHEQQQEVEKQVKQEVSTSNTKYSIFYSAIFFLCIGLFSLFVLKPLYQKINFSGMVFMQITRGDAFYLKTPQGIEVIWDGGMDKTFLQKLSKYRPFFDKNIDLWVITHPDSDHYNGGLEVLKQMNIKMIMLKGVDKKNPQYMEIYALAKAKGVKIIIADSTKDIKIGDIFIDTLYPLQSLYGSKNTEEIGNNFSIVQKLSIFDEDNTKTILLTGDIEKDAENTLLLSGVDVSADILKIGHHGSKSSSSENFLKAVSPQRAIITTGTKNTFHHPHIETLDILNTLKIDFINSKYGDVVVEL